MVSQIIYIYGQAEPQLVTNMLLQLLVREINNSMVIPPEEGQMNESRESEDNIIIIY